MEIDLTDLTHFADGPPWGLFDYMREQEPCHWNPTSDGGFWSITRHHDIVEIARDSATFSSAAAGIQLEDPTPHQNDISRTILTSDGPRHQALRKIMQRQLSGKAVTQYEPFLRSLADAAVEACLNFERVEAVRDLANDYPIRGLAHLLRISPYDMDALIRLTYRVNGIDVPPTGIPDQQSGLYDHIPFASPAALEVFEYADRIAAERKGDDDLLGQLASVLPADGQPVTQSEFQNNFLFLLLAGHETVRTAIGHGIAIIATRPDVQTQLREDPALVRQAVEEFLRWEPPLYRLRRTVTADVMLHGQHLKVGDRVLLWWPSGNRDSRVFENPYDLDIRRVGAGGHMTFGKGGPHFCLGNQLARLEIRVVLEELLARTSWIELDGPIERMRSNFLNGVESLPLRIAAA